MIYWIILLLAVAGFLAVKAVKRGWTTLPSMGGFTFATPAWAKTWWAANWALLMIFLPLWMVMVLLILPALPIGYGAYAAHGGATGWLLVFLVLLLAIAFTIPQKWLRVPMTITLVLLLFWVVAPAVLWTTLGYCSPGDHACIRKEAVVTQDRRLQQQSRSAAATQETKDAYCDGIKDTHVFVAGVGPGEPINKKARCSPMLWYVGHCIYIRQYRGTERLGPFCRSGQEVLPADIEYAWSADTAFEDDVLRRPPIYINAVSIR